MTESSNVRERLRQATGLDLSETAVAHAIRRRLRALGMDDPQHYERLLNGPELAELIEEVVVPESWMFRDPEAFVLARSAVEERLAAGPGARVVRILSLPCAGGEEPYSLAMTLLDAGVPREAWQIDAVDLSPAVLERARQGRFTRNAFRSSGSAGGGDKSFQTRWFRQEDGGYQIDEAVRSQVSFKQGNLLEMTAEQRYDLIFCRNLLIYFDEPTVARAIERLAALLQDDGVLFAGYAEVPAFTRHGFVTMRAPGAFALRKAGAAAPAKATAPAAPRKTPARPRPAAPRKTGQAAAPGRAAASTGKTDKNEQAGTLEQARSLADAGQLQQAAEVCRRLLAEQPDCADAHYLLGIVSETADEGAAAVHYRRCIYLQPDHYEALCHLALLCEHGGDMLQAAAFKQRAARVYARRAGSTP